MTDREKIRAEIERNRKAIRVLNEHTKPEQMSKTCAIFQYSDAILSELLSFIDSLPEETSCPKESDDLEKAARMYAIPHYMKDVDENFLDEYPYDPVAEAAFIAGAEWRKEQMMDVWLKDRDGCFWDGVEEGKKAMEKQMMEGAVEGEIVKDLHNLLYVKSGPLPMPSEFKFGDKVKIIILPVEKK